MRKLENITIVVTLIVCVLLTVITVGGQKSERLEDKIFNKNEAVEIEGTDLAVRQVAYKYFNDPSARWYKGDINTKAFTVKIVPMKRDRYYYNGFTCEDGAVVYINSLIYFNGKQYDTESLIKNNIMSILESILVHELIHVYMYQYYPDMYTENANHGDLFVEMENDFHKAGYVGFDYIKEAE